MKRKLLKIFGVILFIGLVILYLELNNQGQRHSENEKPRVLLTNFHPVRSGGHLTYFKNLINSELGDRCEFAVAAPEKSDVYEVAVEAQGVVHFACDFPGKLRELGDIVRVISRFREICKIYKPDIVHVNGGHDNTIAVLSTLFLKFKPKIVRTFHAAKRIGKDPYHNWLYNTAVSVCIFVSKEAYEYNSEQNGLRLKNAQIVPNGIDLEIFKPMQPQKSLKELLAIPKDTFVLGSCVGLSAVKRVDLMLEAMLKLKETRQDFHVVVLGTENDAYHLLEEAKRLNLSGRFHYAGYHKDVRPYVSIFDVGFILSDTVETLSYGSREMMAMGKPLISANTMGLKSNVDNGINGLLIQPNNLEELVTAIEYFLDLPPNKYIEFSENARKKAEEAFSIDSQVEKMSNIYRDLLRI